MDSRTKAQRTAWTKARVVGREDVTARIAVIEFESAGDAPLPRFEPGSHIDVEVAGVVRQYSLCGPLDSKDHYRIAVQRAISSRGGSIAMNSLEPGDVIPISAPRQAFGLLSGASRHLMLAGGIGITPFVTMMERLDSIGGDYHLDYVVRGREDAAFVNELEARDRVSIHVTGDGGRPAPGDLIGDHEPGAALYVCGPGGFMRDMVAFASGREWPVPAVRTEQFGRDEEVLPASAPGFSIRLSSSGREYRVEPDSSVLQVLRSQRVRVPSSCEAGICGECVVNVVSGEPDHRDDVLTDEERAEGAFTICVSRSLTPVLELDL